MDTDLGDDTITPELAVEMKWAVKDFLENVIHGDPLMQKFGQLAIERIKSRAHRAEVLDWLRVKYRNARRAEALHKRWFAESPCAITAASATYWQNMVSCIKALAYSIDQEFNLDAT